MFLIHVCRSDVCNMFFVYRCGIPVVIMGETGGGKTRLIRFMCNLTSRGSSQRNMLVLKVALAILMCDGRYAL